MLDEKYLEGLSVYQLFYAKESELTIRKIYEYGINGISLVLNFKNPVFMRSSGFEHHVLRQILGSREKSLEPLF